MTSIFAPRRPGQIRFDVFLVAFEGDHVAFIFGHTASSMVTLLHLWSHCFIYGHTASSMVTLLHLWSHCFIDATNIDGTS